MDFGIPTELASLCRTVRAFIEREVDPLAAQIDETDSVPHASTGMRGWRGFMRGAVRYRS